MDTELDSGIFKIETPRDLSYTVSKIQKLKKKYLKKKNNQQSSQDATSKRDSKDSNLNPQECKIQANDSQAFKQYFQKLEMEQPDADWDFNSNIAVSKKIGDRSIIAKKSGMGLYGSKIKSLNSSAPNISNIYSKQIVSGKLNAQKNSSNTKETIEYLENVFDEINLDARQSQILRSKISKVNSSLSNTNKSKIIGGNSSFISKIGYQQPMSDIREQTIEEENYFEDDRYDQDEPRKSKKKQLSQMESNKRIVNTLGQYASNKINADRRTRNSKQRQLSFEKTLLTKKISREQSNTQVQYIPDTSKSINQQNDQIKKANKVQRKIVVNQFDDDSCILTEDQISMGQSLQMSKINKFSKPIQQRTAQIKTNFFVQKTKLSNEQSVPKLIFGIQNQSQIQKTKNWKKYKVNQTDRTSYSINASEQSQIAKKKYSPEASNKYTVAKRNNSESKMKFQANSILQASNIPKKPIKVMEIRDIDPNQSKLKKDKEALLKTTNRKFIDFQEKQPCVLVSDQKLSLFRSIKFQDYINLKPYNLAEQLASIPFEKYGGTAKKLQNIMTKNTVIIQVKSIQENRSQNSQEAPKQRLHDIKLVTLPNQNSPYSGTILRIKRQFSDFVTLRKLFKKFYPSLIIPCLQTANIFSDFPFSTQENIKQKQMDQARRIQLFINEVLKVESLKSSIILAAFLTLKQRNQLANFFEEATSFTSPKGIQNIDLKIIKQRDCSMILQNLIKVELSEDDLLQDQKIKGLRKNVEKWLQNQSKLETQMLKVKEEELSIYKRLKDNAKVLLSTLKMYNQSVRKDDKIEFDDGISANISSIITKTSKNSKLFKKAEYEKIEQIIFDNIMQPYSKQMCNLSEFINQMKELRLPFLRYEAENIKEHKDLKQVQNLCIKKMIQVSQSSKKNEPTQNDQRRRRAATERQSKNKSVYENEDLQRFKIKAKEPSQNMLVLKYQTAYFMKQFRQENKRMITQILSTTVNILSLSSV